MICFVFDLSQAIKIVASFYKVQYEHIKLICCAVCVYMTLFQISRGMFMLLPKSGKTGWRLTMFSQI